ncbi:ATP-binding protein [Aestuariispira insulae]|nr:ATP-binding protein [Aestuariispira insulae]
MTSFQFSKTSGLAWRYAGYIFASLIFIEVMILIPSAVFRYQQLREDLIHEAGHLVELAVDHSNVDSSGIERLISDLLGLNGIVGLAIMPSQHDPVISIGDRVQSDFDFSAFDHHGNILDQDGFIEFGITGTTLPEGMKIVVRLDSTPVFGQLLDYIGMVLFLVVIVAAFLTFASLHITQRLFLLPLAELRSGLLDSIAMQEVVFSNEMLSRPDELGSISRQCRILLKRLFDAKGHLAATNKLLSGELAKRNEGLEKLNDDLTRELASRHVVERDLKKARDRAEKASQAKTEFLSAMSHELRTPLNAIIGFAQILENSRKEPLSERQEKCVRQIRIGGEHLLGLIAGLLDLSKIEAGQIDLEMEPIWPSEVFKEVLELMRSVAQEKEIILEGKRRTDKRILADRDHLKQVMVNLIGNAIKYNRQGGRVEFGCLEEPTGTVCLFVSDTGYGIEEHEIQTIFEPFSRLPNHRETIEGTGIGLTIVRKLVTEMGGEIRCESLVGQGTTFWMDFPVYDLLPKLGKPVYNGHSFKEEHHIEANSGLVLYIEDNPANIALVEMALAEIPDVALVSAPDAEMGIELAKSIKPDLILMDINLPGENGFLAKARLWADEETRAIPVVAISASAMEDDIQLGHDAGFKSYLTKPLDVVRLTDLIRHELQ